MKIKILNCVVLLGLLVTSSCVKDTFDTPEKEIAIEEEATDVLASIEDLNIPSGFEFSTERPVSLEIADAQNGVRYSVVLNGSVVFNAITVNGGVSGALVLPNAVTSVTLLRRTATTLEEIVVPVGSTNITYTN